jgi:putative Mg2+ transporter-C (MgtC) family protein
MPLQLGWQEIALRLALTFGAGLLIGLNRLHKQEAAGLRTTLLVCLAASASMIQVNLLLGVQGKTPSSFAIMDLMRLPLGILTGMGFIGAGAILKRGDIVQGVTTAASLWFTTVIGLCIGGGQLALGIASLGLCLFVLSVLKGLESRLKLEHRARLYLCGPAGNIPRERNERIILNGRGRIICCSTRYQPAEQLQSYEFTVGWRAPERSAESPPFVETLAHEVALTELRWSPVVAGS